MIQKMVNIKTAYIIIFDKYVIIKQPRIVKLFKILFGGLQVYNSMALITLILLCNHHHYF